MIEFSDQEKTAFQNTKYEKLPDGEYIGVLSQAEARLLGKDRSKKLCLTFLVESPANFSGYSYTNFIPLDNPNLYWKLKQILSKFGFNPDEIGLEKVATTLGLKKNSKLLFRLFENGQYQNCEIERVFSAEGESF